MAESTGGGNTAERTTEVSGYGINKYDSQIVFETTAVSGMCFFCNILPTTYD